VIRQNPVLRGGTVLSPAREELTMDQYLCESQERFLYATLVVKVIDPVTRQPVPKLPVRISDDLEAARHKG
jgi:hypothetical protein